MGTNKLKTATQQRASVEIPVTPELVRELRLGVKREWRRSGRSLASDLHISHTLLWMIERGKRPIQDNLADRIRVIYHDYQKDAHIPRTRTMLTIVSRFTLPARLELLAKPVRCDRCGKYFVPRTPNQKRHQWNCVR